MAIQDRDVAGGSGATEKNTSATVWVGGGRNGKAIKIKRDSAGINRDSIAGAKTKITC